MSSVLAIAGVTALLQDMVIERLVTGPAAAAVGSVSVTALPPDRVDLSDTADPTQVNIFLHQVSANTGWANHGAPVRDSRAARIAAPPLALDLHYLVTAYGAAPLLAEILLAQVAQLVHETPVPSRAEINRALDPPSPPPGFPAGLAAAGLADQFEALRITVEPMDREDAARLWTALQARYRPTLPLRVTTVLIDSDLPSRRALPVRTPRLGVFPITRPVIAEVLAVDGPDVPVLPGTELAVLGQGLVASGLSLFIGAVDLSGAITARTPERIDLTLPNPLPAGLRAGAQSVTVHHEGEFGDPPVTREIAVSSPALVVIRPQVTAVFALVSEDTIDGVTYRDGTVTLALTPPAGRSQRVVVLLNGTGGAGGGFSFRAPDGNDLPPETAETASVDVAVRRVPSGTYLLRVQVGAGESVLSEAIDGAFDGPLVTI